MSSQKLGVELVKLESMENDESNSVLYKVMVNRKIVEKVQMNLVAAEAKGLPCFGGGNVARGEVYSLGNVDVNQSDNIESLRQRLSVMQGKYNETFNALNEVRTNALEASERALEREVRVALLEKALHGLEVNLLEAEKRHEESLSRIKQGHIDARREVSIYESQVEQLKRICRERDAKIVTLSSRITRADAEVAALKKRQADLLQQLTLQQQRLEAMVAESKRRDELCNELEADLKRRDGERQAQLLQEIAQASREKIRIETKETQMRSLMASKDSYIRQLNGKVQTLECKLDSLSRAFSMAHKDGPNSAPATAAAPLKTSQTVGKPLPRAGYIINPRVE